MSARAAVRLEMLGIKNVYRYSPGKVDWLANGLPSEGTKAHANHMSELLRRDVPACQPDDRAQEQLERARAAGWDACAVVDPQGVVLGMLCAEMMAAVGEDNAATAGQVMEGGPRTYRFSVSLDRLKRYFEKYPAQEILITSSDGVLMGAVLRRDIV